MPKIAVYAGHGGSDPGAVSDDLREKDLNLALSNEVTRLLRQKGYEVINNRTTDIDRNITQDANLANSNNVDALVEIHQNSNSGVPGTGAETFYSIKDTGKGKSLAQAIQNQLAALGIRDRGIKTRTNSLGQDSLGIIRLTNAPAVLVETAFINNPEDMANFNVSKIAQAIARGIEQVFPISTSSGNPSVIKGIQQTLNNRYNTGLAIDGIVGPKTKQALVKGLQTELNRQYNAGLLVDGIFGNATASAVRNVRIWESGNIVYLIQAALYSKGYNALPDGIFGNQTDAAVRAFQRDSGLDVDGIAGRATQTALFR